MHYGPFRDNLVLMKVLIKNWATNQFSIFTLWLFAVLWRSEGCVLQKLASFEQRSILSLGHNCLPLVTITPGLHCIFMFSQLMYSSCKLCTNTDKIKLSFCILLSFIAGIFCVGICCKCVSTFLHYCWELSREYFSGAFFIFPVSIHRLRSGWIDSLDIYVGLAYPVLIGKWSQS